MSPREQLIAMRLEADLRARLEEYRERFGTPVSEQIRRAIRAWLEAGGMEAEVAKAPKEGARGTQSVRKAARKRAATRKRT